jgi:hypothetical protein
VIACVKRKSDEGDNGEIQKGVSKNHGRDRKK